MRGNSIRTEPDGSLGEKSNTQMRGTTQAAALQQSWSGHVLNPGHQHRSCRERAAGDAVLGLEMVGTFLPFLSDSTRMGKVPSLWAGNSCREFSWGKQLLHSGNHIGVRGAMRMVGSLPWAPQCGEEKGTGKEVTSKRSW